MAPYLPMDKLAVVNHLACKGSTILPLKEVLVSIWSAPGWFHVIFFFIGIIPRSFEHIFEAIDASEDMKYLVHASYLEIYNEEIRDLLSKDIKKALELKENPDKGVYIPGRWNTVWKFQEFSITQILREIKLKDSRSVKAVI